MTPTPAGPHIPAWPLTIAELAKILDKDRATMHRALSTANELHAFDPAVHPEPPQPANPGDRPARYHGQEFLAWWPHRARPPQGRPPTLQETAMGPTFTFAVGADTFTATHRWTQFGGASIQITDAGGVDLGTMTWRVGDPLASFRHTSAWQRLAPSNPQLAADDQQDLVDNHRQEFRERFAAAALAWAQQDTPSGTKQITVTGSLVRTMTWRPIRLDLFCGECTRVWPLGGTLTTVTDSSPDETLVRRGAVSDGRAYQVHSEEELAHRPPDKRPGPGVVEATTMACPACRDWERRHGTLPTSQTT